MAVFYQEKQQFRNPWMWALIGISFVPVNAIFIYGCYQQLLLGEPWGNKPMGDTALLLTTLSTLVVSLALIGIALHTELTLTLKDKTVFYRLGPVMREKAIHFSDIKDWQVKPINPITDYGGYGWRLTRQSRAYILNGQHALVIQPHSGKKIAISTQNPQAVAAAFSREWQRFNTKI